MLTLQQALARATDNLHASPSALLDAQVLLAEVLQVNRSWLYAWPEQQLDAAQQQQFDALCARRALGEPVAYLLGRRDFWSLTVKTTPAVLIPRPETETLVELALQLGSLESGAIADLGTGSGAIALALATERPQWQVHATELSAAALAVAQTNFQESVLPNLQLLAGSWCAPLPKIKFSMIVSNPPYIDAADAHLEQGDVRFEPRCALVAAGNGLADLQEIAQQARTCLQAQGWLLLEHGWQQGEQTRFILTALGYTGVTTHQDQGGRERVTAGRLESDLYE